MPLQPIFCADAQACPGKARPSRQSKHSSMSTRTDSDRFHQPELARFDHLQDLLAFDGGKAFQEIVNGFAAFKGVDEVLKRYPRADEHRRAAEDVGVALDDLLPRPLVHAVILTGPPGGVNHRRGKDFFTRVYVIH